MVHRKRLRYAIGVLGAFMAVVPRISVPQDQAPSPGEQLLHATCTQCHGLRPILATRDGVGGWRQTVNKMISWGAQIRTAEEREQLVAYLVASAGPAAGPMTTGPLPPAAALRSADPAALPPGPGADLVKGYCSMCHDLGLVVATRRGATEWRRISAAMLSKALIKPSDEDLRRMNDYLIANFATASAGASR